MFTACKPTSSIITSKDDAIKKGIYKEPAVVKTSTSKATKPQKETRSKQGITQILQFKKPSKVNEQNDNDIFTDSDNPNYLISQLINTASDNLGVTYRGGGTTKAGFDCSGLMYSIFKKFDISLPRSSYQMAEVGKNIDLNEAKKGDLIFFINRGQSRINHVGMIVDVKGDEIKFIHSSTQSGVIISSLKESYYDRTFKQINRVIQ
ncbi:C40 family peptidase [Flavobacterium sp.]|uniref:C40 family peptidase n=1 Tax=Flavobacterium sp. TaxID=239 RepID=UPI0024870E6F|nr:C40 family peptidase [Flavobacterium sp.]MDI1316475.1 NlpC/P60 family protein [Flavobacterium sp.]